MLRFFTCLLVIFFISFKVQADTIEIRYHLAQAEGPEIIWGINGWAYSAARPPGTFIKHNVMHTPMHKEGDDLVVRFSLPANTTLDYMFYFRKKAGPFKLRFNYLDENKLNGNKYYNSLVNGNSLISLKPNFMNIKPTKEVPLFNYSLFFFFVFGIAAFIIYAVKKIIFKTAASPLKPVYLFAAISFSLLFTLLIIRAMVTDLVVPFLVSPITTLPLIFKTAYPDFIYTFFFTLLFGCLFFIRKKKPALILWAFGFFAILSIVAGLANIKIVALLGKPFTYQWLYYSDFLNSTEAKRAVIANADNRSLLAYLVMLLSSVSLLILLYQLLIKKPILVLVLFIVCAGVGLIAKNDLSIPQHKRENPVTFFLSSLTNLDGIPSFSDKNNFYQNEFIVKNKNVIQPQYAASFAKAGITNVILYVLESTPAEYVTPYNPAYQTTPFLDSIKSNAAIFDNIYSHAPTTNISLVSLLCGNFPYLSYKTLTASKPDIKWSSISSELKGAGYRNSFLNSADNRYNGAGNFIQNRGFDEIQDYRQNPCNTDTFDNKRFGIDNLDGINDSCLPVKFFTWIGNNNATPFFSLMWTFQTHYPYYPTGTMIDFKTNNESLERYLNALHHSDKILEQLVEGLKKRGLLNSTLIVVTGDHGEAFGRHGHISHGGGIFEEDLHIPCMLINPLLFKGEHLNTPGGMSDLAPTIFSILNKPIPTAWQGEDLFSINRRKRVYYFNPYADLQFGCRDGDYKMIYNATMDTTALYNLKNDPYEMENISAKEPKVVKETKQHLIGWIEYQTKYVNSFLK